MEWMAAVGLLLQEGKSCFIGPLMIRVALPDGTDLAAADRELHERASAKLAPPVAPDSGTVEFPWACRDCGAFGVVELPADGAMMYARTVTQLIQDAHPEHVVVSAALPDSGNVGLQGERLILLVPARDFVFYVWHF